MLSTYNRVPFDFPRFFNHITSAPHLMAPLCSVGPLAVGHEALQGVFSSSGGWTPQIMGILPWENWIKLAHPSGVVSPQCSNHKDGTSTVWSNIPLESWWIPFRFLWWFLHPIWFNMRLTRQLSPKRFTCISSLLKGIWFFDFFRGYRVANGSFMGL